MALGEIKVDIQPMNFHRVQAAVANIGAAAGTEFAARFIVKDIKEQGNITNITAELKGMKCVAPAPPEEELGGKPTFIFKDPRLIDPTKITISGSVFIYGPQCPGCKFLTKGCVILKDLNSVK